MRFRIGFVINPLAGLGGSVALKGSDGAAIVREALRRGAVSRVEERAAVAFGALSGHRQRVSCYSWGGAMGHDLLTRLGFDTTALGEAQSDSTSAADTRAAVAAFVRRGVDLIVFTGGDGTARDVLDAMGASQPVAGHEQPVRVDEGLASAGPSDELPVPSIPVLGIPAGVKMHSAVFAVSASAAGEVLLSLATGKLVSLQAGEVRDIDEAALRRGLIRSSYYGELLVPESARFMQHLKDSGHEVETLVIDEIAEYVVEQMVPGVTYLLGPGSTTRAVMQRMGLSSTLLGVDVVRDQQLLHRDAGEAEILALLAGRLAGRACLIVTPPGGQGSLLGRGNQQISPQVLRRIGTDNVLIISSKRKMGELSGRPLLVDTGDRELDVALSGYRRVLTGYRDHILYPVSTELALDENSS
jgi:predicted polyphosphate/ATP-dependent NAD kinase